MLEQTLLLLQGMPGGAEIFFLLFLLVGLVGFIIWVGLAYWVYRDANRRNMDNAVLWAVITFFLGLIGLVIYILVRD
jgi:preprotein translocase subunit Sss1